LRRRIYGTATGAYVAVPKLASRRRSFGAATQN
jgi:hypothetical protein